MPLNEIEIKQLVFSPSLGAVAYQGYLLTQQLNRITDEEYSPQACIIRDVLLCYAEFCLDELLKLYKDDHEKASKQKERERSKRIRDLGEVIRELYSYIRYLLASSPKQSPPALQRAVNQLITTYFPKGAGISVCVVRPQWKYNLQYVPLTSKISKAVPTALLDPNGNLGLENSEDILPKWWGKRRAKRKDKKIIGKHPPNQLAILSFAGLDTSDTLCFPLLAHELGHFIDFSEDPPHYLSQEIRASSAIRLDEVVAVIKRVTGQPPSRPEETVDVTTRLANRASVCLREILADLLATRIMGFAFFIAQAEFLKTLAPWSQQTVLPSGNPAGYPGIRFRLWVILRHLLHFHPNNPRTFLEAYKDKESDAEMLLKYLDEWILLLDPDNPEPPGQPEKEKLIKLETELSELPVKAVLNTLEGITKTAQKIVPDDECAKLTPTFFNRIAKLTREYPPSCHNENARSFSEIMSAAWSYEIIYGGEREDAQRDIDSKYKEYEKTCDLVLKAIELIPEAQAIKLKAKHGEHSTEFDDREWLKARGVLSAQHITKRVQLPIADEAHLAVFPLNLKAIKGSSLDVHLGSRFSYARRTKLSSVKITDPKEKELLRTLGREDVFIPADKEFLLHPGDLVLGVTLEFLGLPKDIMAFVEGKSGLGRLGLFVATATQVAPGYHGVIVLELANAGTVPLKLSPGMPIAQLVFQVMTEATPGYHGEYQCQIKP